MIVSSAIKHYVSGGLNSYFKVAGARQLLIGAAGHLIHKLTYNRTRKLKHLVKDMLKMFDVKCFFCDHHLHDVYSITVHHKNGNHDDNRSSNLTLAHESCHRGYHAKQVLHA